MAGTLEPHVDVSFKSVLVVFSAGGPVRIGELARRAGVSVRSLRYYEEQGLVTPGRTSGGHREYLDSDVDRVRFIQLLFSAGLPSRTILQVLPFLDTGVTTPGMRARLDDEHARIQHQIEELTAARDRLADLRVIAAQSVAGRPAQECRSAACSVVSSQDPLGRRVRQPSHRTT